VNLFWLSPPRLLARRGHLDYSWCARQHINAHIIKIPLEAAQLLYTAHHVHPAAKDWRNHAPMAKTGIRGYMPVHVKNPIALWVRANAAHYRHAAAYGLALCKEYSLRYGREHACEAHLAWLQDNEPDIPGAAMLDGLEPLQRFKVASAPPCSMPDEFKIAPVLDAGTVAHPSSQQTEPAGEAKALPSTPTEERLLKRKRDEEQQAREQEDHTEVDEWSDLISPREGSEDGDNRKAGTAGSTATRKKTKGGAATIMDVEINAHGGDATAIVAPSAQQQLATRTTDEGQDEVEVCPGDGDGEEPTHLEASIEDEVAASEVAFPLHIYQSYRAYYLGQKLSLKMSAFKKRDVPHWAQQRVREIQTLKAAAAKAKKKTASVAPKAAPITSRRKRRIHSITTSTASRTRRSQRSTKTAKKEEIKDD